MSTKYSTGDRRLVEDDVALTDHAIQRYRERTPHDFHLDPRVCWHRGEDIQHPQVCQTLDKDEPPARVRVYKHGDAWGISFVVTEASDGHRAGRAPYIVQTVVDFQLWDHGPTRAYLHSHGPHDGGDGR